MNQSSAEEPTDKTHKAKKSRLNLLMAWLSLLVCAAVPLSALLGSQTSFGKINDFPEYYASMKMICSGQGADIYKLGQLFEAQHRYFPSMANRGVGFYIPPFACPWLLLFGLLPPEPSYLLFIVSSTICLLAAAVILGRHFKIGLEGTLWTLTLIFATAPAFESLKIAQLAPFLFAAFAFFLYFAGQKKDLPAGLSLSLLLLKPQELFPLALYCLCSGRFKIIISLALVFLLFLILSLGLIGTNGYANYLALLKDSASNTQFMQPELSATVRGQLLRFSFLPGTLANQISSAFLLASSAAIAWVAFKHGRGSHFQTGLLCLALPLGLLSALHCHDYDLLLLAPWGLALFCSKNQGRLWKAAQIVFLLFVVGLCIPFYVPIHYQCLIKQNQAINPLFWLFAFAAALSVAASYRALAEQGKDFVESE